MSVNQIFWKAYCTAGDYFSCLGGRGRYSGFSEYHIPALVLIMAIEKADPRSSQEGVLRHLLPEEMWTKTDGLALRVSKVIDEWTCAELSQIKEFVEYVNTIYQKNAPTEFVSWVSFQNEVEALGWRI